METAALFLVFAAFQPQHRDFYSIAYTLPPLGGMPFKSSALYRLSIRMFLRMQNSMS